MAAGTLKSLWRNSACLILGSGPIQYLSRPLISENSLLNTYVIESGDSPEREEEFLFVKRSFKSGFMVCIVSMCICVICVNITHSFNGSCHSI